MAVLMLPFVLTSCNDDNENNPGARWEQEVAAIDEYLESNNLTAIKDPSGVRMVITVMGTGFPAQSFSEVDVDYIGKLFSDGSTFDEGNVKTDIRGLIEGWQAALTTLPAGSKATIFIPSLLGYADVSQPSIPANSTLMFHIAFNEVIKSSSYDTRLGLDSVAVDNYLDSKGIVAQKDTAGLRYLVTQLGTGAKPGWYDKIKVKIDYKLMSDDTKVIHTLQFEPSENYFSRVIDQIPNGLKQGLQQLPAGSKATFYLVSGLAYGPPGASSGSQTIVPPNSNMIMEVDFTEIVP
jgi:FKBP-type peptidyl-prolyl cis-trans isomerase